MHSLYFFNCNIYYHNYHNILRLYVLLCRCVLAGD